MESERDIEPLVFMALTIITMIFYIVICYSSRIIQIPEGTKQNTIVEVQK